MIKGCLKGCLVSFLVVIAIIVLICFSIYNKEKPYYSYENGTWNYVWYSFGQGGKQISPIDVNKDEFRKMKYKNFARDDESVYFKASKIEGSDPDTFEVISTKGRQHYAKDKNFVYIYSDDGGIYRVIGADPETFEVLDFPYAKDKNDAYNGCLPLYVDDVNKFEVIEAGGISKISSIETFLGTAINPEDVAKYNNEKYSFINSAVLYSDEGKAKTEKLVYEGYMIVEEK